MSLPQTSENYAIRTNVRSVDESRQTFQRLQSILNSIKTSIGEQQSAAPTVTDDVTAGWENGSTWIFNQVTYVLTDNSANAANWQQVVATHPTLGGVANPAALKGDEDYVGVFDDSASKHVRVILNDLVSAGIVSGLAAGLLTDLSDVTLKTGTGTTVVMQSAPLVLNMLVGFSLKMNQSSETRFKDFSNAPLIGLIQSASAGTNRNYLTLENNVSGSDPIIGVKSDLSTDANVGLNMVPIGDGEIQQRGHKIPGITVGAEPSTKTTGDFWFDNT